MADLLQGFGLLGSFGSLFPFLLVLVVVFAVLSKIKFPTKNASVHALIALIVAFMFMFSPKAVTALNIAAPWFIIFFLFGVFSIIAFMLFGATEGDIAKQLMKGTTLTNWLITITLIIVLGSLSYVTFGSGGQAAPAEGTQEGVQPGTASGTGSSAFWATLTHPKVLGLIAVLLIAMFTLRALSYYAA